MKRQRVAMFLFVVFAAVPLVATLSGLLPGPWWTDLFNHLALHLALGAAVWAIASIAVRSRVGFALSALTVGIQALRVAPALLPSAAAAPGGREITVLFANVRGANHDHAALTALIERLDPDLVGLVEVTPAWAAVADAALPGYHATVKARDDNFGLGLWSREPMEGSVEYYGAAPSVVGRFDGFAVLLTHPMPPVSGRLARDRDDQLAEIAREWHDLGERVVVMGDLNATPWSRPFRELVATGLSDTRDGRGMQSSWPTFVPAWFGIPIDHVLVHGLSARERRIEADIGSDHRPVYVRLVLP